MKKKIKKLLTLMLITMLCAVLSGCTGTCDVCGNTFLGDGYFYGSNYEKTACRDCASQYWEPFNADNFKK